MHDALNIRSRMAEAAGRIRRLKRIDRAAVGFISLGGIAVIVSVIGILVFIAWQAVPLFRGASAQAVGTTALPSAVAAPSNGTRFQEPQVFRPAALGVDEYLLHLYTIEADGQLTLWDYKSGARQQGFPLPGLDGATVVASSRSLVGDFFAAATSDGRVALAQVRYLPVFEGQTQTGIDVQVRDRGLVELDPGRRPIRDVSYRETDGRRTVAGIVADNEIALWWTDENEEAHTSVLKSGNPEVFTRVRIGHGNSLAAGTRSGKVYHWEIDGDVRLTDVSPVGDAPVTALAFALGDNTVIVGDQEGNLSGWFKARPDPRSDHLAMMRVHAFENQGTEITAIGASSRDKGFVSAGADGSVVLRHLTSQRTLVTLPKQDAPALAAIIAPRNDAVVVALGSGQVARFALANPHPESTLRTLFGRVWYEGYSGPEYVWQSTGATDDFESKISLVPLVFGTIKATLYALLFAVPLAVLGALYASQFVHPGIRSKVKPTVEIMAALPSVVIGFIAGLWLAGMVEHHLVAVLAAAPVMLLAGTGGFIIWNALPRGWLHGLRAGSELLLIVPLLLAGALAASLAAPAIEATVFGGDIRVFLNAIGLTYDQRNSLVVGLAMGFAVIPIIFTISDDAFQSVPESLKAASLALGASRWQTAVRVVLPTASPGVFSAIMIGFGRAIGETMIVLMATGNTPVMDWSIFNGMRTLSANIAVEIPEAPLGGTLYRVLFLSAALLFMLTFLINTVAELIRQRLRDRYKAV